MRKDISTVKGRERLKPQSEPYWHRIATGRFLGFRPSMVGKGGTWIARSYDAATSRNSFHSLGDFGDLPASDRFNAASDAAREWFDHIGRGGTAKVITVGEACRRYVEHLKAEGKASNAKDAAGRFARFIDGTPLAALALPKLTRAHVQTWRRTMAATPCLPQGRNAKRPKERAPAPTAKRSSSTINRDMVPLRAALNLAKADGYATADVWTVALAPIEGANGRRDLYLNRDQRRALLAELPDDLRPFVAALCALPIRPGAVAALRVSDFERHAGMLHVGADKAGAGRKVPLPPSAVALLREAARDKLPAAPLFCRADGRPWDRDMWKDPIKAAVRAAKLPAEATAYTLRHSAITDLVTGGLDLFHVAVLAGTSVAMIEKHYGQLRREHAREALAALAL